MNSSTEPTDFQENSDYELEEKFTRKGSRKSQRNLPWW